jgi:hypothetical protein
MEVVYDPWVFITDTGGRSYIVRWEGQFDMFDILTVKED